MKRFLLIAGFADSIVKFRGRLIESAAKRGYEVHVAAPELLASTVGSELRAMGVILHDIPLGRSGLNPFADLRTLLSLIVLIGRLRPEVVLGYTIKPVIYGTLAAWIMRVPRRFAMITGLGHAFQEQQGRGLLRRVVEYLYVVALRGAHTVFFQNPDDEALFRNLNIIRAKARTVVVNGSGVDVAEYAVAPLPAGHAFLLIARLLGDKGVRIYADAARRLRQRHPGAKFRLVGWIDQNPNAIRQDELDGWVRDGIIEHLGRLADVRPAIADTSVYVLPSFYREGTPRTVLEAMAMGRAVVTTDAPGCRETVVDGENGFLVPVKSADALEAAMERFIAEPGLAARMGRRSREIAETKYDVHAVNEGMLREMGIQ
ncbi:glycosyltransferase family 4 protein [Solimonas sp. SE-A11]|uniref:glycosyltransferase family 4 protein n=1 Tax=Solimonas sp. SE-A11 TaxID=3054954 RepID=UPI00259CB58E|nr:glycosyltransferase family 4 protein [Solimonas sp. SE-A11]MDM4769742.1 glycosyltransferase family 4 protein [Solimonas sp. SE-A11]